MIDVQKQWTPADFPLGRQDLAMAIEGTSGKLVVIGQWQFLW